MLSQRRKLQEVKLFAHDYATEKYPRGQTMGFGVKKILV